MIFCKMKKVFHFTQVYKLEKYTQQCSWKPLLVLVFKVQRFDKQSMKK
jgi:hypothetical protein